MALSKTALREFEANKEAHRASYASAISDIRNICETGKIASLVGGRSVSGVFPGISKYSGMSVLDKMIRSGLVKHSSAAKLRSMSNSSSKLFTQTKGHGLPYGSVNHTYMFYLTREAIAEEYLNEWKDLFSTKKTPVAITNGGLSAKVGTLYFSMYTVADSSVVRYCKWLANRQNTCYRVCLSVVLRDTRKLDNPILSSYPSAVNRERYKSADIALKRLLPQDVPVVLEAYREALKYSLADLSKAIAALTNKDDYSINRICPYDRWHSLTKDYLQNINSYDSIPVTRLKERLGAESLSSLLYVYHSLTYNESVSITQSLKQAFRGTTGPAGYETGIVESVLRSYPDSTLVRFLNDSSNFAFIPAFLVEVECQVEQRVSSIRTSSFVRSPLSKILSEKLGMKIPQILETSAQGLVDGDEKQRLTRLRDHINTVSGISLGRPILSSGLSLSETSKYMNEPIHIFRALMRKNLWLNQL